MVKYLKFSWEENEVQKRSLIGIAYDKGNVKIRRNKIELCCIKKI